MASTLPLEVYTQENVGRDFLSKLPRFASSLEAQQFRCGEKYPSTKCCVGLFGRTAAGQSVFILVTDWRPYCFVRLPFD